MTHASAFCTTRAHIPASLAVVGHFPRLARGLPSLTSMMWLILLFAQQSLVLLALRPGVPRSRRLLAAVLVAVVPIAGPLLALMVRRARGGGMALSSEPVEASSSCEWAADVRRAGELSPPLERLMSSDPEERLAALVKLSVSADVAAVALLRWAVEHGTREVVLDAALTLEELDLRREKRLDAARRTFLAMPTFEHALAAAEAAAYGVLTGLADDASVLALATQAREFYQRALELEPLHAMDIEERMARLELAAARPAAALEILDRLAARQGPAGAQRLLPLRDEAAFAARRFDRLSFA